MLNEKLHTYAALDNAILTTTGATIGVLSLSGIEPASVSMNDRDVITTLLRNVFQRLPMNVSITQYYIHTDNTKVTFKKRKRARAQLVSSRRAKFLNEKRALNSSFLYWAVSLSPSENMNGVFTQSFLKNLFNSLFSVEAKDALKKSLSYKDAFVIEFEALKKQLESLKQILSSIDTRLSFVSHDNSVLGNNALWGFNKMLVNLNPDHLKSNNAPPLTRWDKALPDGDVSVVMEKGLHFIKIAGAKPIYARLASVVGVGEEFMPESVFLGGGESVPVLLKGSYIFLNKYTPYSRSEQLKSISEKEQEMYRSQMRVGDFMSGNSSATGMLERIKSDPRLLSMMHELEEAKNGADKYGVSETAVIIFDENPDVVKALSLTMSRVLEECEFHLIWESVGILDAYERIQLGGETQSLRSAVINSTQAGAMSLAFRSNEGLPTWQFGATTEESVYVLESDDGVPFHYTPFVGDKCLVIGVGPTRSGKTFFKNCIATHFTKLGGMYTALDIDKGSEPLCRFFRDEGALFRLSDNGDSAGFNPFAMAIDENDFAFRHHMTSLFKMMLLTNDSAEMQVFTTEEQLEVDDALFKTLKLPEPKLRNLSGFLAHCTKPIQQKLSRFKKGGVYGRLFDNVEDAVGVLDKPFSVYNTEAVKDIPAIASLVNTEIFFRAVRLFEDPKNREVAKFLEVDECQYVLNQAGAAEFLIAKARTWFKHGGGMGFWTQSPKHYSALKEWSTLRSAATTFIFMSDPEMTNEDYLFAFPFLTNDECEIIKNLKAKQQAFIKQMDVDIAKVVNLFVEPEQYVIATSRPHEAALAGRVFDEEPDVDKAIDRIIKELGL